MVLFESSEQELGRFSYDLCRKLGLDLAVASSAWDTYKSISKKFSMEGEKIYWVGCSIYAAFQSIENPVALYSSAVKPRGFHLTFLLKQCNMSFMQFFTNISRWSEMAQLPDEFNTKINQLKTNFSIASNIFKKFTPLFQEIFQPPIPNAQDVEAYQQRVKRNRPIPFTSLKLFEFVWNLFITLKVESPTCSEELIKAHHLMYSCLDFAFRNVVAADRRDLLTSAINDELDQCNFSSKDLKDLPCMVKRFCENDSMVKEALLMKVYTFKQLMNKLIETRTLVIDADFTRAFNDTQFEVNFKHIHTAYEIYLLSRANFDERIFLAEFKRTTIAKDGTSELYLYESGIRKIQFTGDATDEAVLESPKVSNQSKVLDTPLSGRRFLGPRGNDSDVRSASERVSSLHSIMTDCTAEPSEKLKEIFKLCERDPTEKIAGIIEKLTTLFVENHVKHRGTKTEAENLADYGQTLFYKYVEMVLIKEQTITANISALVEKEIFYQCMYACCLEIVLYCYNSPLKFPWILEATQVEPVHFVKVIELIVRVKDNLFRELIKHLNRIEETVIESLAWRSNSPIWEVIGKSGQDIPKFQDTALPDHLLCSDISNDNLIQSPGPPSATDRFQSPLSQFCKTLFPSNGHTVLQVGPRSHLMVPDKDGKVKLIPLVEGDIKVESGQQNNFKVDAQTPIRRTGSLSIIYRKFYNLAGVRMQHLCSILDFHDIELRRKIWTIFENSIRLTDLIKDRHLDQLLMCAIYVICKAGNITKHANLFTVIMKFYRQQPQASSAVYRDVLIEREKIVDGKTIPEERGNLIHFYNSVYVKAMQTFAVKFQPNVNLNKNIALSPLPATRKTCFAANMQVVDNVFVKRFEGSSPSCGSTFDYYFNRSPSKDLMNINRAINEGFIQGKRLLIDNDDNMLSTKRNRKLQSLVEDRQRQNASK